jgi:hypothetical protein
VAIIVKTMKSPRSALIKTSIMACTDVFSNLGQSLLSPEEKEKRAFDNLVNQRTFVYSIGVKNPKV